MSLGVFAASAGAYEEGGVTLPGAPLSVSVGKLGQCQSSYPNHGNNYFPGEGNVGDCGFFLAFPKAENIEKNGKNRGLASQTYGFTGSAGPDAPPLDPYIAESQSAVTGSGIATDPYSYSVTYGVDDGEEATTKYAKVTDTTTYVSGEPQFTSTYTVTNTSGKTIYFRAAYAGDLYVNGDDLGTGVFLAGPPKFIGGLNTVGGVLGGFVESSQGPPWSAFQELDYPNVWTTLEETVEQPTAFNNTTEPAEIDNAAGVEWDQFREPGTGLKDKESTSFTIINRTQIPSNLKVNPLNQTLTQGQTETVSVTAQDLANQPYAGKSLHYTVAGANPQSGAVTLNSAGQAQISYVGSHPGLDTIQMYVDLVGNSVQTQGDPAAAATVTFVPLPPTPNSTYKVQSIKANSNGTVTIVFVPIQAGVANLEVTVPTGTIARNEAIAAKKAKKCKKNQIKLKGKCQSKITTSGKVSATGVAGVPLTLTVKPSGKVASALKKGKTVHLTATLTYKSTLGGTPTVQTFHVTVKGKKAKKGHKKH